LLPTVSLQVDFQGPVHAGEWLEGDAQVPKVTKSMVFAQGLAHVGGYPVLRCSGTYKIAAEIAPSSPGMYTHEAPDLLPKRRQ
jgi:acyl-coenzyme A thioesterase PaaI-like protein